MIQQKGISLEKSSNLHLLQSFIILTILINYINLINKFSYNKIKIPAQKMRCNQIKKIISNRKKINQSLKLISKVLPRQKIQINKSIKNKRLKARKRNKRLKIKHNKKFTRTLCKLIKSQFKPIEVKMTQTKTEQTIYHKVIMLKMTIQLLTKSRC